VSDNDIIAAVAPDAVSLMDKAIAEIKRLRAENSTLTAERDEARREVCRHEADGADCEREYAAMRGWDCFPEAEPH
jgi:hypothetical protein